VVPRRLLSIARTLRDDRALAEQICQACVDGLDHRRGCDLGGYAWPQEESAVADALLDGRHDDRPEW
jgi:hypothetical protein